MAARKASVISRALRAKGFIEEERGKHIFSYFVADGKRTGVFTFRSRGSGHKDVGSDLLGKMARQLKLQQKDFLDLIDCTYSAEMYRTHLVAIQAIP